MGDWDESFVAELTEIRVALQAIAKALGPQDARPMGVDEARRRAHADMAREAFLRMLPRELDDRPVDQVVFQVLAVSARRAADAWLGRDSDDDPSLNARERFEKLVAAARDGRDHVTVDDLLDIFRKAKSIASAGIAGLAMEALANMSGMTMAAMADRLSTPAGTDALRVALQGVKWRPR